jgi:S-adenosylmethionine decarboxylase
MGHYVGKHTIYDLHYPVDAKILKKSKLALAAMIFACKESGAVVLSEYAHKFEGDGYTFVIALSESHASVHTWPEHGIMTVDIFMCGKCNSHDAMKFFVNVLTKKGHKPSSVVEFVMGRGWAQDERNSDPLKELKEMT